MTVIKPNVFNPIKVHRGCGTVTLCGISTANIPDSYLGYWTTTTCKNCRRVARAHKLDIRPRRVGVFA